MVYGSKFRVLPIYYANSIICFPLGTYLATLDRTHLNKLIRYIIPMTVCLLVLYYLSLVWYYGIILCIVIAPLASLASVSICSYTKNYSKLILYIGHNSLLFYVLQITYLDPLEKLKNPILYCILVTICIIISTVLYTKGSSIYKFLKKEDASSKT